jgi:hypothetical protein
VSSDGANIKALLRVLWGKTNWVACAGRTLGCSKRHIYRLTGGQRRLTPRAIAILEAREISGDLAMAYARAAEERSLFPWAPRYLAELRERMERRQADALAAKLVQRQRRESAELDLGGKTHGICEPFGSAERGWSDPQFDFKNTQFG